MAAAGRTTVLRRGEDLSDPPPKRRSAAATLGQFQYLMLSRVMPRRSSGHRPSPAPMAPRSLTDEGLRVTLDSDISLSAGPRQSSAVWQQSRQRIVPSAAKSAPTKRGCRHAAGDRAQWTRLLGWLRELTREMDLRRTRFSKYIAAVQNEAMGPGRNGPAAADAGAAVVPRQRGQERSDLGGYAPGWD